MPSQAAWNFYVKLCLFYCIKVRECQSYVDGESVSATVLNWVMPLLHRRWNSVSLLFQAGLVPDLLDSLLLHQAGWIPELRRHWNSVYYTASAVWMPALSVSLFTVLSLVDAWTLSTVQQYLFSCEKTQPSESVLLFSNFCAANFVKMTP